jgi:hypothetical protein
MGWVLNATPSSLPLEESDTHCVGAWVDLTPAVDGLGKSRPPSGFDPRTVQRTASRYTD